MNPLPRAIRWKILPNTSAVVRFTLSLWCVAPDTPFGEVRRLESFFLVNPVTYA